MTFCLHNILRWCVDQKKFSTWLQVDWPCGIATVSEGDQWRFIDEGREHIVMPFGQQDVEGGPLIEATALLAFRSSNPERVGWFEHTRARGGVLGECSMTHAEVYRRPLVVHDTPLDWLRAGCKGVWLVDDEAVERLRDFEALTCSSAMQERVRRVLTRMPNFTPLVSTLKKKG